MVRTVLLASRWRAEPVVTRFGEHNLARRLLAFCGLTYRCRPTATSPTMNCEAWSKRPAAPSPEASAWATPASTAAPRRGCSRRTLCASSTTPSPSPSRPSTGPRGPRGPSACTGWRHFPLPGGTDRTAPSQRRLRRMFATDCVATCSGSPRRSRMASSSSARWTPPSSSGPSAARQRREQDYQAPARAHGIGEVEDLLDRDGGALVGLLLAGALDAAPATAATASAIAPSGLPGPQAGEDPVAKWPWGSP